MKPANLLVLMSDEHNPKIMGASGHRIVKTPHLDALAARGHRVVSIGKLHFRGHPQDDNGFSEEIIPMNIIEGDPSEKHRSPTRNTPQTARISRHGREFHAVTDVA